ncbi:hypothetical protein [Endozoicomonas sp. GU-1]|uniref:hypothetical protein n=1 Tax=Endozoicomonas sp. GU-1 TaxID=3009078 RepID=UPI0022B3DE0B|nr:hypothetical protein [Endozoicomonas sp. GU-1]WBA81829.1 hypothetical protein O2T12_01260 [Endozoicomonas sp. GU-1]
MVSDGLILADLYAGMLAKTLKILIDNGLPWSDHPGAFFPALLFANSCLVLLLPIACLSRVGDQEKRLSGQQGRVLATIGPWNYLVRQI